MYYTKEKSDLWHELQPKSFHLCVFKLPDNISDHNASVVILQCSKNISQSFKREIWQYQKINYEKFETADTSKWFLSDVRGGGVSCIITADTSKWFLSDVRGGWCLITADTSNSLRMLIHIVNYCIREKTS
jgi:hypothetical protein